MNNSSFATLLSTIMAASSFAASSPCKGMMAAACAAVWGLMGIVYFVRERKSHV